MKQPWPRVIPQAIPPVENSLPATSIAAPLAALAAAPPATAAAEPPATALPACATPSATPHTASHALLL